MSYSTRFVARRVKNLRAELAHFQSLSVGLSDLQIGATCAEKQKNEAYELLELAAQGLASAAEEREIAREYKCAVKRANKAKDAFEQAGGRKTLARHRRAIKAIKAEIAELEAEDRSNNSGLTQSPFEGLWAAFPPSPAK